MPMLPEELIRAEFSAAARDGTEWTTLAVSLGAAADDLWAAADRGSSRFNELFPENPETGERGPQLVGFLPDDFRTMSAMSYRRIALMLLGMAFEAQAKALLLERHPEAVDVEKGRIHPELATHDLVALLARCGLPMQKAEIDAVRSLAEYVKWAGRYPVPISAVQKDRRAPQGGWQLVRMGYLNSIWRVARPLFEDLEDFADLQDHPRAEPYQGT